MFTVYGEDKIIKTPDNKMPKAIKTFIADLLRLSFHNYHHGKKACMTNVSVKY